MQKQNAKLTPLIRFNPAAMDSTDPNVKVDLAARDASGNYVLKGYQYFQTYLDQTGLFSSEERTLIKSLLPVLRDWYVQAGTSGMLATAGTDRMRWRLIAANDEATKVWRVAA